MRLDKDFDAPALMALEGAVIQSAAARAKPIALIFGILVSTVLTLVVIPVLYYVVQARQAR